MRPGFGDPSELAAAGDCDSHVVPYDIISEQPPSSRGWRWLSVESKK